MSYETWIPKAREILHQTDAPLKVKNGIRTVTQKVELLRLLDSRLLDLNLKAFETIALKILEEQDPALLIPQRRDFSKLPAWQ